MHHLFKITTLLCLISACGNNNKLATEEYQINDALSATESPTCWYPFDSVTTETFTDENNQNYTITVSVDIEKNYQMRAVHVAELVSFMSAMHEYMELPEHNAVVDLLSSGHIVVVEDNNMYYEWFRGSIEDELGMDAAMVVIAPNYPCWETPIEANWTILIHASYYNAASLSVLTHRLVHVVSAAMTGDRDNEHVTPELWVNWEAPDNSDRESLQARTYLMYEALHGRCNRDAPLDQEPPFVTPQEDPYTE